MENTLNDQPKEDESSQNYNLWISNKITDKQYFHAINNLKSK